MNNADNKSTTANRRSEIVRLLDEESHVDVNELSNLFGVSAVSIRKDLAYLESHNLLIRTRGGAINRPKVAVELGLSERAKQQVEEKQRIGEAAAKLIDHGDSIILDSGTTTIEIAKRIKNLENLSVLTHALNIALELSSIRGIKLIMPGGTLHQKSFTFLGPTAENTLRQYYCDKCFLGAYGVDSMKGLYTPSEAEAALNRGMVEISRETVLVADSSKFGKRSLSFIVPIEKISIVITDSGIPEEDQKNLLDHGIELVLV